MKIIKNSKKSQARLGLLRTRHGVIKTPFFMPVATQGTIKQVSSLEMAKLKPQILLSNTYHLMLRPGEKLVRKMGGLHGFMGWNGPILTDSGGFQVFSLAQGRNKSNEKLVKLSEQGVKFKSYIDGKRYELTPEKSLDIQHQLGVDIAVCLDECVALPAEKEYIEKSLELTTRWAERSKQHLKGLKGEKPLLFAVVQGGLDENLRLKSLEQLTKIGFDGYNIGGLSVGEHTDDMYRIVHFLAPKMPADKPRYLMGVGYPEDILEAVKSGVDMFDCVIPTREGRHGRLYAFKKNFKLSAKKSFYDTINITNAKFQTDKSPINANSSVPELKRFSKAYLNHLFRIGEPLGQRLATLNNLEFYLTLMSNIRENIKNNHL